MHPTAQYTHVLLRKAFVPFFPFNKRVEFILFTQMLHMQGLTVAGLHEEIPLNNC